MNLRQVLEDFEPEGRLETGDVARARSLAATSDPWDRATPLHVTASALVVHPPTRQVLLRWHDRLERWLHVGGHGDPGEDRPFEIARREAREESGLDDLVAWPEPDRPQLIQVVMVSVPARALEPAHEHVDLRYVLATTRPERARPESETTPLRWLDLAQAMEVVGQDNLAVALSRLAAALDGAPPPQ